MLFYTGEGWVAVQFRIIFLGFVDIDFQVGERGEEFEVAWTLPGKSKCQQCQQPFL